MAEADQPGARYWSLIEPVWRAISIYDGPETFLRQFRAVRPEVGHLFAAQWCQSEVCNGGLHQFFFNSTGVLAPEAVEGFRAIGLAEWAECLAKAMRFFGSPYPRGRAERQEMLHSRRGGKRVEWDPFYRLDERFFAWLHAEPHRWERAADRYAERSGAERGIAADRGRDAGFPE
jgi:hypothetical protein